MCPSFCVSHTQFTRNNSNNNDNNNNSWLFPDFILGSQGNGEVTLHFPEAEIWEQLQPPPHRPQEGTQVLALPVGVLGLTWAGLTWHIMFWEVLGKFSTLSSGPFTVSKILPFILQSALRTGWGPRGHLQSSFYDGGNWGPQITKLINNRTKKRPLCVK